VVAFSTDKGEFFVPINATLPSISIDIPEAIDFNLVSVNETGKQTHTIRNVGQVDFTFLWSVNKPFTITPSSGFLKKGQSLPFQVFFKPTDAGVWNARAVVMINDSSSSRYTKSMQIRGIGKYSFLHISSPQINFGDIIVGRTAEKQFEIFNKSMVSTSFNITRVTDHSETLFRLSKTSGTIAAKSSISIQVCCCCLPQFFFFFFLFLNSSYPANCCRSTTHPMPVRVMHQRLLRSPRLAEIPSYSSALELETVPFFFFF
jgi:hypothetical protein